MTRTARLLLVLVVTATTGWAGGELVGVHGLSGSPTYQMLATTLLAAGLYGSTSGISLAVARKELGVIVFATTVGVAVKAMVIMGAMYLFVDPRYTILGLVVAQIDPLSVAAMLDRSAMSDRAKTILRAWSSFDDPVTTLLTIYALAKIGAARPRNGAVHGVGLLEYAGGIWANLLFVCGAWLLWLILDRALAPDRSWLPLRWRGLAPTLRQQVLVMALILLMAIAVWKVLMFGLAIAGLFFRPVLGRVLPAVLHGALIAATFALGLLLVDGVTPGAGCALAVFAVLSQVLAAWLLPTRLNVPDRCALACGQQNGITAIILALAIEPALPGTVAIVAPAILAINVSHLAANSALSWWLDRTQRLSRRPLCAAAEDSSA